MKKIILAFSTFLILTVTCSLLRAEGVILPPDDGGVIIVPDPGEEPEPPVIEPDPGEEPEPPVEPPEDPDPEPEYPSGEPDDKPDSEYEIWITMPDSGISGGKPRYRRKIAYKYDILSLFIDDIEVASATVSMERYRWKSKKGDPQKPKVYGNVDITDELNRLIDHDINNVLIIVAYDSKEYKGELEVVIEYMEYSDVGKVDFTVSGAILPKVLNLGSTREYILSKISVEGSYSPKDIDVETVRITEVGGEYIGSVYGETEYPEMNVNENFLIMHFSLENMRGKIPLGENVTFRVDGKFNDGMGFVCVSAIWVIDPSSGEDDGSQGNKEKKASKRMGWGKGGSLKIDGEVEIDIDDDALEQDVEITIDTGIDDPGHSVNKTPEGVDDFIDRKQAIRKQNLKPIGKGVRFGPSGLYFRKPVVLILYYDEDEADADNLKIFFWNAKNNAWEEVPGSVALVNEKKVVVEINHFSIYQIMLAPEQGPVGPGAKTSDDYFRKGEIYSFPNPAKNGASPTIHVDVGHADTVTLAMYDTAGIKVHTADITGLLKEENGTYVYEYTWDVSGVASGIYIYSVRAVKQGYADIHEVKKLAVIK